MRNSILLLAVMLLAPLHGESANERPESVFDERVPTLMNRHGILRLVEQEVLALDDPVGEHLQTWTLPPTAFDHADVTIRRVLSHSAGLPAGFYPDQSQNSGSYTLQELLDGRDDTPAAVPVAEPGASFTCSNPGFALLEQLNEDVTGEDFGDLLTREVLEPLDMRRSTLAWTDSLAEHLAVQYDLSGGAVSVQPNIVRGHGGLYSTAEDLGRFLAAGMDGGPDQPTAGCFLPKWYPGSTNRRL
jgi:CubicO group peptidase (beta-lactamase class C family)